MLQPVRLEKWRKAKKKKKKKGAANRKAEHDNDRWSSSGGGGGNATRTVRQCRKIKTVLDGRNWFGLGWQALSGSRWTRSSRPRKRKIAALRKAQSNLARNAERLERDSRLLLLPLLLLLLLLLLLQPMPPGLLCFHDNEPPSINHRPREHRFRVGRGAWNFLAASLMARPLGSPPSSASCGYILRRENHRHVGGKKTRVRDIARGEDRGACVATFSRIPAVVRESRNIHRLKIFVRLCEKFRSIK